MTVYRFRVSLGGGEPFPVPLDQGWVALNTACAWQVDVDEYQRHAQEAGADLAAREEALALWRGEPLQEERYEDWAIAIREQMLRLWRDLSLRLPQAAVTRQVYSRAEASIDSVLHLAPLDEGALLAL